MHSRTHCSHGSHVRIYEFSSEACMRPFRHLSLHGVLSQMSFLRVDGQWRLLLLTHEQKLLVMRWDDATDNLLLLSHGDIHERVARGIKSGNKLRCHNDSSCLLMLLYEGLLKYVCLNEPTDPHTPLHVHNIRLPEHDIIDLQIRPTPNNTDPRRIYFSVLYRDSSAQRHVKTYALTPHRSQSTAQHSTESPLKLSTLHETVPVDPQANLMLPLQDGSLIVFGGRVLSYFPHDSLQNSIDIPFDNPTQVTAYTTYEHNSFLFGTCHGSLYQLGIPEDTTINSTGPTITRIGEISIPSDLEYLGDNGLHVASVCADSQLIRIYKDDKSELALSVVDEYENIAPIMDATIVDFDKQGQGSMITCSGMGTSGSLRLVTNGVSIDAETDTELPDATAIFSLSSRERTSHDYLVLSFPTETKVVGFSDEELGEVDIGFDEAMSTLTCATTSYYDFIQVTKQTVRLVGKTGSLLDSWSPDSDGEILLATTCNDYILVSTGHKLFLLEAGVDSLTLVSQSSQRDNLVSSIALRQDVCAIGSWGSYSVEVLNLPDFSPADEPQILKEDIVPRSMLFCQFEGVDYLLVGLGDGTLFYFSLDQSPLKLTGVKKIIIGTKPISLTHFQSHGSSYVFASSDRATIVYSQNKKPIFSNVNVKDLIGLCSFNHEIIPDGLGLITTESLILGRITEIQNIQVKKKELNCQPLRIAFDEPSATIAVCTTQLLNGKDTHHVRLFSAHSLGEEWDNKQLQEYECASAISCIQFPSEESSFYVVGTAFVHPEDKEPRKGRILLYKVSDNKLHLVASEEVKGSVYGFASLHNGKRLLSSVNSRVHMWEWKENKLVHQYTYIGHLLCLTIHTRNDFVLVGDLIHSVMVLRFDEEKNELVEIACDRNMLYVTASAILDDDNFLVCDNARNAVILKKSTSASLVVGGQYHLGETANVICEGSLKMRMDFPDMKTFAYGSTNGAIGIMATLTPKQYQFFEQIQRSMQEICGETLGCLKHSEFHAFKTLNKTLESSAFIDGDFVESYLSMDPSAQEMIANKCNMSSNEIIKQIEKLSRALI